MSGSYSPRRQLGREQQQQMEQNRVLDPRTPWNPTLRMAKMREEYDKLIVERDCMSGMMRCSPAGHNRPAPGQVMLEVGERMFQGRHKVLKIGLGERSFAFVLDGVVVPRHRALGKKFMMVEPRAEGGADLPVPEGRRFANLLRLVRVDEPHPLPIR